MHLQTYERVGFFSFWCLFHYLICWLLILSEHLWGSSLKNRETCWCWNELFLQEIPENGADIAHLGHLHTPGLPSGVDLRYINSKTWEFVRHDWKVIKHFFSLAWNVKSVKSFFLASLLSLCTLLLFSQPKMSSGAFSVSWKHFYRPYQGEFASLYNKSFLISQRNPDIVFIWPL